MSTLTYLANSGLYLGSGIGIGYVLHDIRSTLSKTRNLKVVVVSEEELKKILDRESNETDQ